jgi:hypothetical protein
MTAVARSRKSRSLTRRSQKLYMQKYNRERRDYRRQYHRGKQLWHYQMVRIDHEDAETLRVLAKHKRCSVSELIRTFTTWGIIDLNRDDPV